MNSSERFARFIKNIYIHSDLSFEVHHTIPEDGDVCGGCLCIEKADVHGNHSGTRFAALLEKLGTCKAG